MRKTPAVAQNWKEDDHQIEVAAYLDGLQRLGVLAWNHPPNEGKRDFRYALKLKRCGVKAGEPDCVIYGKNGRVVFIELKRHGGMVSAAQKARHVLLRGLGYAVFVLAEETPRQTVAVVEKILRDEGISR